jgi:hypothetical protein
MSDTTASDARPNFVARPPARPHVVTLEMGARGSELLAESFAASERGMALDRAASELKALSQEAWESCRLKREAASKLLMGPNHGYRDY